MRKLLLTTSFVALVTAASALAIYEADDAQHRKPSPPAGQTQQPPQTPRPATPATPRDGHTSPPDAPKTGQAVPRPPEARNEPEHPRRPPHGPVVIPYPIGPWWYPYGYSYPPYGGWRVYADWERASVRIDVTPNDAQVYVDRYYAGVVDDYDGIFQRLVLRPGAHLLEIRKTGYRSLVTELNLYAGESITYRRTMEPSTAEDVASTLPPPPGFAEGAAPPVDAPAGDIKFDVVPKDAEIYADGFYAGIVDDFNGSQHLQLAPGMHHLSIELTGYETIAVDVLVSSERTITYRAQLTKKK